ncbi:hypothetical protein HK103_000978 [Boothiomyces macroporosus]|uniref:DUF4110 domain-containing protein n=1 Tax=Boothiomyces macroporosus TaxID=261099 RepID=A0AAD5UMF7_9FUNG|nr:hypothetical protein HK103_000978 [Boothiomyces macroporosus]
MGKGRDKKKKLKKKEPKEEKVKEEKKSKKSRKDEDVEDIDAILDEFRKQQTDMYKVTEEANCAPPSRRANASLSVNPLNPSELILFGGEYYDGQKVYMYNDFFKYNIEKKEWKRITSPNSPGPRSSHQVVITPAGLLFLWGGEFVSPNETSFFHYKDFWMMDLKTNQWEKLEMKGRPPPRSGHRMTLWKHFIVLFGGFYDQTNDSKYYDDVWIFDTIEFKWSKVDVPEPRPPARSAFQFMPYGDQIILYGGYSKAATKGKKVNGMVHVDAWCLKMSFDLKAIRWERKKKCGGIVPGQRSGCTTVFFKGKGIMFGGVSDIQEDEETIESVVHGDMFQYQIDGNKWYPLTLKSKGKKQKKEKKVVHDSDDSDADISEQVEQIEISKPLWPGERFNTMLVVVKNQLYMYGGILENKNKEITLNDLWTINLERMDEWVEIIKDDVAHLEWYGVDSDMEEDDEDEEEDDEEEEEEEESDMEIDEKDKVIVQDIDEDSDEDKPPQMTPEQLKAQMENDPLPGEPLNDYYSRTNIYWQERVLEITGRTGKALRKNAFEYAYKRYQELLPQNKILEEQMREQEALLEAEQAKQKEKGETGVARHRNR